ncbi:MAG: hypothetical protein K9G61_00845 [Bacteroidales bacterium]|nr:hypothetical protein [Bacteroidales bacterium]
MRRVITISILVLLVGIVFFAPNDESVREEDKATHAAEYLKYRRKSRADANGNIPMDGLIKAKEHIAKMTNQSRDAGLWEWEWMGPTNIGGRIRTILPDPNNSNNIWIGSASGGIWKTTNGGATWSPVNDFLPSLSISSLVFDPSTTAVMYAATGEGFGNEDALPGAGIFKSIDSGVTWTQLPSTNNIDFMYVNRLAAHPNPDSSGIIYAVTNANKAFKTTDGGVSWETILFITNDPTDIRISPVNHNKIIVGTKRDVFLSLDYGENWVQQTTGAANKLPATGVRCEVTFCPSNANRIYVSMDRNLGEIWRSDDNGDTWVRRNTGTNYFGNPTSQGWYDNAIWVNPENSDQLIVGGVDLFRSTDGGSSLTQISRWQDYHNGGNANSAHADQHVIIEASDYNQSTNPVVYFGNDGGIQMTEDIWSVTNNSGWINLANTSLGITQFFGGAASDDGSIIVGGAQDNDKLRYKSTGTWSGINNWFQAQTGDGGYAAINYNNPSIVYGSYIRLGIKKSTDGGDSYVYSNSGISDAGNKFRSLFISPFSMDPNNPAKLVAGGSRIYRTIDHADNWTQIRADIGSPFGSSYYYVCSAIDIAKGNSGIIWVGYDNGQVAMTSDTGAVWNIVDINGVGLPNRYVTDIAINPNNSNQVFVTFGEYEPDNIWYTPDAGQTWENRSGTAPNDLPALQVNTIRVHPTNGNWVYIGTDLGVFASEDRGENWSVITNPNYGSTGHEGPVNTEVSELFWQGDEFLIAATHGRGMYRTGGPVYKIYVNSNAAPGGDGSQNRPFKTVEEAASVAGPGSYIYIEAGVYNESSIILLMNKGYVVATNGNVIIQ